MKTYSTENKEKPDIEIAPEARQELLRMLAAARGGGEHPQQFLAARFG